MIKNPFLGDCATHALCSLRHLKIARDLCPRIHHNDAKAELTYALESLRSALEQMNICPDTAEVRDYPEQ